VCKAKENPKGQQIDTGKSYLRQFALVAAGYDFRQVPRSTPAGVLARVPGVVLPQLLLPLSGPVSS